MKAKTTFLLCFLWICSLSASSADDDLDIKLLRKGRGETRECHALTNAAVEAVQWITDDYEAESKAQYTEYYDKTPEENSDKILDVTLETEWTAEDNYEMEISVPPFTDVRWERLPIQLTRLRGDRFSAAFDSSRATFSLKGGGDARIVLQSSYYRTAEYEVIIAGRRDNPGSSVKNCQRGQCHDILTLAEGNLLNASEWRHFTLSIVDGQISLDVIEPSSTRNVLKCAVHPSKHNRIDELAFSSTGASLAWKLHNRKIHYITNQHSGSEGKVIKARATVDPDQGYFCLSFWYYISPGNANDKLTIKVGDAEEEIRRGDNGPARWKRFVVEYPRLSTKERRGLDVVISGNVYSEIIAVDDFRRCGPNTDSSHYSSISTDRDVTCGPAFHSMKTSDGGVCSERCSNGGVCMDGRCQCMPAYSGPNCDRVCGKDSFGKNCTGKCQDSCTSTRICDVVNGRCDCAAGYRGDNCEVFVEVEFLRPSNALILLNATRDSLTISAQFIRKRSPMVLHYRMEHKRADESTWPPSDHFKISRWSSESSAIVNFVQTLTGLQPGTAYDVRVVQNPLNLTGNRTVTVMNQFRTTSESAPPVGPEPRVSQGSTGSAATGDSDSRSVIIWSTIGVVVAITTIFTVFACLKRCRSSGPEAMFRYHEQQVEKYARSKRQASRPIPVDEIKAYNAKFIASGELRRQYEMLPMKRMQFGYRGKSLINEDKNRYSNLLPYDKYRVILPKVDPTTHNDYINASYVPTERSEKAYIATQGPLLRTAVDFWRMVWHDDVHIILMMTNFMEKGVVKCDKYWTNLGTDFTYGEITVKTVEEDNVADYTFRKILVTCKEEEREVMHCHFKSWPDYGVPQYPHSMSIFMKKVLDLPTGMAPIIVHCSAGVGRTGATIIIDAMARRGAFDKNVDCLAQFRLCRQSRPHMVATYEQYEFVHHVLADIFHADRAAIPCVKFPSRFADMCHNTGAGFKQHLNLLNDHNDYFKILPRRYGRPFSSRTLDGWGEPELGYVIDGYHTKERYIAAAFPHHQHLNLFWDLTYAEQVHTIVILQEPEERPSLFAQGSSKQYNILIASEQEHSPSIHIKQLRLANKANDKFMTRTLDIRVIIKRDWKATGGLTAQGLLDIYKFIENDEPQTDAGRPVMVICKNGVSGCGVFVAGSYMFEKLKATHDVDAFLAVKKAREGRYEFIQTPEQLAVLYHAATLYLESPEFPVICIEK